MTVFHTLTGTSRKLPAELYLLDGPQVVAFQEGERRVVAEGGEDGWSVDGDSRPLVRAVWTGPDDGYVRVYLDGKSVEKGAKARLEMEAENAEIRLNGRAVCELVDGCWFRLSRGGERKGAVEQVVIGGDDALELLARPWAMILEPTVRPRPSGLA